MNEMPKPTEAHRRLAPLAGRWTGQETIPPSPMDPKGGTAVGRCDNKIAVDGFAVIHDYEQERHGAICFRGHGVFTYDSNAKSYLLHWWDSMGMAVNVFKGDFQGNKLQMLCPEGPFQSRVTWEFPAPGSYRFAMDMSQDGKNWQPMMLGDYVRLG